MAPPAFAGSLTEPAPVAAPIAPAPVISTGGDWTGFYAGVQVGNLDIGGSNLANELGGDDTAYGLHAGYNYDFGRWVLGGELDYDWTDVDLDDAGVALGETVDSVWRAKLRGGYDFGSVLLFGTLGYADVDTSFGSEGGDFYGVGLSYKLTPQFILTGEYLKHNFDDLTGVTGFDAEADSISLRASWQF
ncbi:outer membrane protein [Roseobacter ponti]|uniref:Porin family protein n=1 Tax=Roseobacter ponti TaxID=1891787 RepID=A0A858SRS4_9RHOB|nr:porin [Roseobacter ponti]QJF50311.1 porin family protein [Roseobacter ponti]